MGGGNYNGKNHSGEHTGDGKKQKCGPYSANGYRPEPEISHKDFVVGSKVNYTGTNKNKNKNYIPNGTLGVIMEKDNSYKLQKTSRSILKVDFGEQGVRYVHMNVLQLVGSFEENQDYVLDTTDKEGIQSERNDKKKKVQKKLRPAKYANILENRENNKEFREWRKDHLDEKQIDIQNDINELQSTPEYKQKKETKKKLTEEIEGIQEKHTLAKEHETKTKFISEYMENNPQHTHEQCEKEYVKQKDNDFKRLKYLKNELLKVKEYFESSSDEIKKLNEVMNRGDRQFVYNVTGKDDYNTYLHHHYEQRNKVDKVDYDYKKYLLEPSREYKVDPNVKATEPENINLLLWGLYPHQVC